MEVIVHKIRCPLCGGQSYVSIEMFEKLRY